MAIRVAAERPALPGPPGRDAGQLAFLPQAALADELPHAGLRTVPDVAGDDDDPGEIFDGPAADDLYADAFEVLE
jgi:hypothetical protein